ncbi:MAG TPA: sugar phosphate isomerase/epimerase, partial [Blastocatellia bacterium]|nr:sugar phosphate isomerase/epimerase [Blastocatellia bacterium]
MSQMTRREWSRFAFGGLAGVAMSPYAWGGAKKINSKFNGVQIGAQSYSFRDRSLDDLIKAMAEIGIGSCELWQGHVEPRQLSREALREWRLSVPLDHFKQVRAKFDRAGVELYAYNLSFRDDFTDAEIERGFEMARALGVRVMTASSTVNAAPRIDRYAKR